MDRSLGPGGGLCLELDLVLNRGPVTSSHLPGRPAVQMCVCVFVFSERVVSESRLFFFFCLFKKFFLKIKKKNHRVQLFKNAVLVSAA